MTHDPLCPLTSCVGPVCYGNDCACQCEVIAKVREDERAVVVQRVEALPWTSQTWNAHAERASIIDTIKGEQS